MPSHVIYRSKRLIPAPFVSLNKTYERNEDRTKINALFSIELRGTLVAYRGSPSSSGTFWEVSGYPPDEDVGDDSRLGAILRKQQAILNLFSVEGGNLEIQSADATAPVKFNPRVVSVEFPQGPWFDRCEYVVRLEDDADEEDNVQEATEDWSMDPADETGRTFRLTHNVSARGKIVYLEDGELSGTPHLFARDYVINRLGLGLDTQWMFASGVLDAFNLQAFNYTRAQSVSERGGTFGVVETWVCLDPSGEPPAIDDYSVTVRASQDGRNNVSVEGSVTGLEVRDNNTYAFSSSRWTNSKNKWENYIRPALLARAQSLSGLTLHPLPLGVQVGYNQVGGVISYGYEYSDRPNDSRFPGALESSVTITNDHPADVYASVPVLGRLAGPVLQNLSMATSRRRSVSVDVQMPPASGDWYPSMPDSTQVVLDNRPAGSVIFLDQDTENWSPDTGRYQRNTVFTWQS